MSRLAWGLGPDSGAGPQAASDLEDSSEEAKSFEIFQKALFQAPVNDQLPANLFLARKDEVYRLVMCIEQHQVCIVLDPWIGSASIPECGQKPFSPLRLPFRTARVKWLNHIILSFFLDVNRASLSDDHVLLLLAIDPPFGPEIREI